MGWAKLDDQYTDHPKVVAAGPMAELLDIRGIVHCARYETDGHIQAAQLPRIAIGITSPKKQAAKLVEVGRWIEVEDGWQVHDFLEYHPSKAKKDEERAEARERMANARKNKAKGSQGSSGDVRPNTPENSAGTSGNPDPAPPVVPNGTRESTSPKGSDRASRLPDGWKPDPEPELVKAIGGDVAARRELEKFRDYWVAQPGAKGRKVDWQATWRNWLRRAGEGRDGKQVDRASLIGTGGVA